tara:strand:- start:118617 stop:119249 length:633 start_codon:yes stop_codon:yes gene_type:complete
MKKMTLFTFVMSSFILLSCSNEDKTLQEDLIAVAAKTEAIQENDYLYGIEIYYSSAEIEIKRLALQKTKLAAEFENGNKGVVEQIENIQEEIEKLKRFNESLRFIKKPIGAKGPMPPKPCFIDNRSNCVPLQNLSTKTVIVLGKELMVTHVIVKNNRNDSVDTAFQPVEDQFGQNALQLKTSLKGEGVMYTTLKIKDVGEITIPTPVVSL